MRTLKRILPAFIAVALLLILLTPVASVSATTGPVLPTAFYGTVTLNGSAAPAGTVITGTITGAVGAPGNGSITVTTPGQYGVQGLGAKLTIQTDNSADIGKTIVFSAQVANYNIAAITTTAVYDSDIHQVNFTLTGTYVPPTGGGGGGGSPTTSTTTTTTTAAAATTQLTLTIQGTTKTTTIDANGKTGETIDVLSPDGKLDVTIPGGTTCLLNGKPITELAANPITPPSPPPGDAVIGLAYDLKPNGAVFSPPITLTFEYDPASLPAGTSESSLTIAWYDESTGSWVILDSVVDPVTHTITAKVSHFSTFALIGTITGTTTTPAIITTSTVPPPPTSLTTTVTTPSSTTETIPSTSSTTTKTGGVSVGLIIGIVAAVIVIAVVITVIMRTRKK